MLAILCAGILMATLLGISRASPQATVQDSQPQEVTTREVQPSFRLQVQRNLVLVRVVVRDAHGHVVSNLRKEDFKLFDNRKPQVISQFSVETPASPPAVQPKPPPQEPSPETPEAPGPAPSVGWRYQALYFDDLNVPFEDLAHARAAADRFLGTSLAPSDRAGIFTSSGLNTLDFTDDGAKLHEALFKLRPHARINPRSECPEISDYQADRIVNFEDRDAIAVAVDELVNRCHEDPRGAEEAVKIYARHAYVQYEYQAHLALQTLEQLVRRMGTLPGQRNVILVSGGFLPLGLQSLVGEVADRALRSNVIISSLDPKGLPVLLREADASRRYLPGGSLIASIHTLDFAREEAASAVLAQLAEDTGGEFFHNNNDLLGGFAKVAGAPETYYVLAFTPQNLKYDGRLHSLKVTLAHAHGYSVRARRGYFAPKKLLDAGAQAKEEVEAAAFSQDELNELPVDVHTQYFKSENGDAQLSVLIHLDIHSLRFRKEEGRNANDLTFLTILFDRNGNFAARGEKDVTLRLRDSTLEKLLGTGISLKTSFTVKPGTYLLRQVVRDSEGGQLTALNSTVEIAY
jgi:VWFA-related protein